MLVKELTVGFLVIKVSDVAEVLGLQSTLHFQREVVVHFEQHIGEMEVLASVSILPGNESTSEWDELASVPRTSLGEVRVDNDGSKGYSREG